MSDGVTDAKRDGMRLLLTGDVHIGRTPGRLPAEERRDHSCTRAWERIVGQAIGEKARAVLVAGDLVDEGNRFMEAQGALARGARRLHAAGIDLVLVAGNHDVRVLPEISATIDLPNVHLLGAGGAWQRLLLEDAGGHAVQVMGWSYPPRGGVVNPLGAFPAGQVAGGVCCIGLLHSDFGNPGSQYCGTGAADYRGLPVDLWCVGHTHKPALVSLEGGGRILIPGSPQGMDTGPGELGAHGPWLATVNAGGIAVEQLPTAPLRFDIAEIDLSAAGDLDSVSRLVWAGLAELVDGCKRQQPDLKSLGVVMRLVGNCPLRARQIENVLSPQFAEPVFVHDVAVHLAELSVATRPAVDVGALAGSGGVLGLVARIAADGLTGDDAAKLAGCVASRVGQVLADRAFQGLDDGGEEHSPPDCRDLARQQAWRLLEELCQTT